MRLGDSNVTNFAQWRQELEQAHQHDGPHGAIAAALNSSTGHRAVVLTSFGAESAVLLKLVADVDPGAPVVFLETGKHFASTLAYVKTVTDRLALTNVRSPHPDPDVIKTSDPEGDLYARDPDRCCFLRKVLPLRDALAGFDGYISGRKRFQAETRQDLSLSTLVDDKLQINPLVDWSEDDIDAAFERWNLPHHPLRVDGYRSIGCAPCTAKPVNGEQRAGRWPGFEKTECGIHESYFDNF